MIDLIIEKSQRGVFVKIFINDLAKQKSIDKLLRYQGKFLQLYNYANNDDKMADARRTFDWDMQWECSIDPDTAKNIRESRKPEIEESCSMCGKFCAVRSMNKALNGEHIDIL